MVLHLPMVDGPRSCTDQSCLGIRKQKVLVFVGVSMGHYMRQALVVSEDFPCKDVGRVSKALAADCAVLLRCGLKRARDEMPV